MRNQAEAWVQAETSGASSESGANVPSYAVLSQVDGMLLRRFHLMLADRQDVIAQALLDYVRAGLDVRRSNDAFFVVIARRRACDLLRHRMRF